MMPGCSNEKKLDTAVRKFGPVAKNGLDKFGARNHFLVVSNAGIERRRSRPPRMIG
jgi:hypothetical protein